MLKIKTPHICAVLKDGFCLVCGEQVSLRARPYVAFGKYFIRASVDESQLRIQGPMGETLVLDEIDFDRLWNQEF